MPVAEWLQGFLSWTHLGWLVAPLWWFIDLTVVDVWFAAVDDWWDVVFAPWRP
jgi:hypothetical protein